MRIYVVRRADRGALYLPMTGTKQKPNLLFFMPQAKGKMIDQGYLDELVRSQLEKQGVSKESDVHALVGKAEEQYELRRKMEEAHTEAKRLMIIRALGGKLMSVGFRKWRQAFYRPKKED